MTFCGLDFGTSNSTIGVVKDGRQTMVPLEQDNDGQWHTTLPSALFFGFEEDQIDFGRRAIGRYTDGEPGRLLRSMKSLLGSSFMSDSTQVKNRFYTFDEIIGFFVASLKEQAEHFLESGLMLDSVVMGRPVYFNDTDPALDSAAEAHLAEIARLAGFKEVSFQFEPIAAALDYERQVSNEEMALIIDIGGGTSDFTLVRLSSRRHQNADRKQDFLGSHGVHIGGTDFDRRLSVAGIMPEFGMGMPLTDRPSLKMPGHYYHDLASWHKIHLLYDRSVLRELKHFRPTVSDRNRLDRLIELLSHRKGHRLASLVENAKIALSLQSDTEVDLQQLFADNTNISIDNCVLTETLLLESLTRDVARIFSAMDETLHQAGLHRRDIDTIFTTGGSTALPMVQDCIERAFPQARRVAGDLYNSVGKGLLMEANQRYGGC